MCVPDNSELKKKIMKEAHSMPYTVHPGSTKMYQDLRNTFWWTNMKREMAEYVSQCLTCQQVKTEHQRPAGPLQSLAIPQWKWEYITMDFVTGLSRTPKGNDVIWVIVDRLTKSAHFLPYGTGLTLDGLAKLYVDEIVRLHGIPRNIVSDRNSILTTRYWKSFQKAMGSKLAFSTTFHLLSDGQSERTIQTPEDMLRTCVLDLKGS